MFEVLVPSRAISLHVLNTAIPGITWVDFVFPLFLFAMGAAFPLAFQRRLAAG